jgi:hypothetical protein
VTKLVVQCCGTVIINYGSGSDSGSHIGKVLVPVPVPDLDLFSTVLQQQQNLNKILPLQC